MTSFPRVLVTWKDIVGVEETWVDLDEARAVRVAVVDTMGWVITNDEEFLIIVSSLFRDHSDAGSVTTIPKGCIVSIRQITETAPYQPPANL